MSPPTTWPDPGATRADVDAFMVEHAPKARAAEAAHEAPAVVNGPSIMCAACGAVRIRVLDGPFCKGCAAAM